MAWMYFITWITVCVLVVSITYMPDVITKLNAVNVSVANSEFLTKGILLGYAFFLILFCIYFIFINTYYAEKLFNKIVKKKEKVV
jgi:hypothetical protein